MLVRLAKTLSATKRSQLAVVTVTTGGGGGGELSGQSYQLASARHFPFVCFTHALSKFGLSAARRNDLSHELIALPHHRGGFRALRFVQPSSIARVQMPCSRADGGGDGDSDGGCGEATIGDGDGGRNIGSGGGGVYVCFS